MGNVYATVSDVIALGRTLNANETDKAERYCEIASAKLRIQASKYGKSIDSMITADEDYELAVKEIVVKSVIRALDANADSNPAAIQASQAAMGYSVSMTYLNSGQALYFLKNELKDLGIIRQRFGAMEVFDVESND